MHHYKSWYWCFEAAVFAAQNRKALITFFQVFDEAELFCGFLRPTLLLHFRLFCDCSLCPSRPGCHGCCARPCQERWLRMFLEIVALLLLSNSNWMWIWKPVQDEFIFFPVPAEHGGESCSTHCSFCQRWSRHFSNQGGTIQEAPSQRFWYRQLLQWWIMPPIAVLC